MSNDRIAVAIVGPGPYGLSVAAHLAARGVGFRIFGSPMRTWREGMPRGMRLKSDGFASNLYDPARHFTLERFCAERNIPYDPLRIPVRLDTFVAYGLAFQSRVVPNVEERDVVSISHQQGGYSLKLADGTLVYASRVVIATGISYFEYIPPELAALPATLCSHSSAHHDLTRFAGSKLVVVGGGSSATDLALLLHQAGAQVQVVARHGVVFHDGPGKGPRSLWQRIRAPHLGLGASMRSALYTLFPGHFRLLPARMRLRIVRRHLGPAGGWFIRDAFFSSGIPVHAGYTPRSAVPVTSGGVAIQLSGGDGSTLELTADHVIAATGYRVDLARLPFLSSDMRDAIEVAGGYPVLSGNFESSLPGLYFVGLAAAGSFGPLLRFALGANYTATRVARHLSSASAGKASRPTPQAALSDV